MWVPGLIRPLVESGTICDDLKVHRVLHWKNCVRHSGIFQKGSVRSPLMIRRGHKATEPVPSPLASQEGGGWAVGSAEEWTREGHGGARVSCQKGLPVLFQGPRPASPWTGGHAGTWHVCFTNRPVSMQIWITKSKIGNQIFGNVHYFTLRNNRILIDR